MIKLIKTSSILILILITNIQCFAVKSSINIPFKNINANIDLQYYKAEERYENYSERQDRLRDKFEKDQANKELTENKKRRQRYFYDTEPKSEKQRHSNSQNDVSGVDIQLVINDPKTCTDIALSKRRLNRPQGEMPSTIYFQEDFMFHGKSAKIEYTAKVEYGSNGGREVVNSIDVNVQNASINKIDWPKTDSCKELSSIL